MPHYCSYTTVENTPDFQVEVCTECKKKQVYKKINDRVDNKKYLEDHVRDFAQPGGRTDNIFKQYYGNYKPTK